MNFTREPIIETVITPREGCKLLVRNSKGGGQEDYFVDAVEVVSFGHSFFFRSQERPKSFMVPVGDYEILELKETRMVLKNSGSERSIKIGGGRDTPPPRQQPQPQQVRVVEPEEPAEESAQDPTADRGVDKKRGRRSRRRRTPSTSSEAKSESVSGLQQEDGVESEVSGREIGEAAPSFISKLFPPPTTLIKETLSRYKTSEAGIIIQTKAEVDAANEGIFEHPVEAEKTPSPAKEPEEISLPDADVMPLDDDETKVED